MRTIKKINAPNRLRILHILPELEEGGVERLIPVYAKHQLARGHAVTVVSHGGRLVSTLPEGTTHLQMPVHKKNPLIILGCAARVAALAKKEKIDIVHAHSRMPAWVAYFAKKFAPKIKFIYSAHARFSTLNYGAKAIGRADGAICVSHSVETHLKTWLPPTAPVRVIYNAPPGRVIPWQGSGDAVDKHLLFVGRISDKKDPLTIVEALALSRNTHWVLDVLGDGPAMPMLKARIRELGLEDKIRLHGFSNDVPAFIEKCDLFLFPSLDEEGLPLTLIEVLSAGAPVIASDISATRELTQKKGSASDELLPVGDVERWHQAIESFLDGTSIPALKLQVKLPTPEKMVEQMTDFYREILKGANLPSQ